MYGSVTVVIESDRVAVLVKPLVLRQRIRERISDEREIVRERIEHFLWRRHMIFSLTEIIIKLKK